MEQKSETNQEKYKETELGEIPTSWNIFELKDFLISQVRKRVKPSTNYKSIGIRSHGKGTFLKLDCDPKKIALENLYEVKYRDLITNITFAWEGAIALVKKEDDGALVSHRFPTYTFNEEIVLPEFFQYVILQRWFVNELGLISPGSAGRNRVLRKTDFLKIKVPIPNIQDQKTIATILLQIKESIKNSENLINTLNEFKKSLMKHLFTYGPVSLEEAKTVKLRDTDVGEISADWNAVKLGDIADFKNGINFNIEQKGNIGILTIDVLNMYGGLYVDLNNLYRVNKNVESSYLLDDGDILFVRSSFKQEGVGWTSLFKKIKEPVTYCGFIIRAKLKKKDISPEFLVNFLRTEIARKNLVASSGKVAITNINQGMLGRIPVPLPSFPIQQQIAFILSSVDDKIEIEEFKKKSLEELFKSLLNNLMNAKIRVNHLEITSDGEITHDA